jgi:hypothetical protein
MNFSVDHHHICVISGAIYPEFHGFFLLYPIEEHILVLLTLFSFSFFLRLTLCTCFLTKTTSLVVLLTPPCNRVALGLFVFLFVLFFVFCFF